MPTLSSKRVLIDGKLQPATIHFDEGKIIRIETEDRGPRTEDLVIMPGIVDSHVHVNEPGRTEWEGFETATRAAAAGGITTIVDMPLNSIPPTTTVDAMYEKAQAMAGKLRVDVGLWGGVIPGNVHELRVMLAEGALGFKCFLVHSGVDEFPNVDEQQLRDAAGELAGTGAPLLVHAELAEKLREPHGDPHSYATYLRTRPNAAEDAAIEMLARVAEETGAWIHIVHLSSASALDIIRRTKMTVETTPHYLHFDAEQVPDGRYEFKCAPPIREHENRERLWRGLADGTIGLVVSDHSPCTPHLKGHDFMKAWGGISSVQLLLPVVWTEARRHGHSIEDVARWICEGPARLAGLRNKGAIAAGNDADFVVWSPEESFAVDESMIEHRHTLTPYAGETLHGVVKETWLRGEQVYTNGEHRGEPRGEWLRNREPSPPR